MTSDNPSVLVRKAGHQRTTRRVKRTGSRRRSQPSRAGVVQEVPKGNGQPPEVVRITTITALTTSWSRRSRRRPRRPSSDPRKTVTLNRNRRGIDSDLERIRAEPHADGEEQVEARRALSVHPDLDRVPPDVEILSKRLDRPVDRPMDRAAQKLREAAGTARPGQQALRRQHAAHGDGCPPFPLSPNWSCSSSVDTYPLGEEEESTMPKSRPPYPAAFRQQMVELVRSGRTPGELAREFEPSAEAIRNGRIPDFPVTRSHPPASWPSAANSSICRTYRKTAGEESRRRSPVANRWMRP